MTWADALLGNYGEGGGMLDGYGLHTIIWDSADERLGDFLVASPADATGRGLELHVRQGGRASDLTGAEVYFLWRHKATGRRGCELMEEIDESLGQYVVYYPAAMQEAEGAVDAQLMVTHDGKSISTRAFTIRVEPVIIGGTESEDGFTLFVETIMRYEGAIEITTAAADAANEAAEAASDAADSATAVANAIQAATQRGDYDGADGADGFSPTATITQTIEGATITITDKSGTTTANVSKGVKGDKGDTGDVDPQGPKGDTGEQEPQGIQGLTGPQGPKGDTGATGAIGRYVGLGFTPWDGVTGPTHRQHLTSATFAADMAGFSYLNFNYLFYSCTSLASVNGLGNLSGVRSMRYTFSSYAFTTIDFRGFDPSMFTDLFYTFSGCSKLTTILADASWALPSSGITGSQCFYSCSTSLVGGNGTTWASNKAAYTYFSIDTASTPGYITVA